MAWKDSGNNVHHLQFGSLRARLELGYSRFPEHWALSCPGLLPASSVGLATELLPAVKLNAVTRLMELLSEASEELGASV